LNSWQRSSSLDWASSIDLLENITSLRGRSKQQLVPDDFLYSYDGRQTLSRLVAYETLLVQTKCFEGSSLASSLVATMPPSYFDSSSSD
jgi:hypothetical protein